MDTAYWQKQVTDKPLFPDLLWSKPQNKAQAGKLLIIGGNSFGFSAIGEAYDVAEAAGAGSVRVLLPVAIRKVVGSIIEHADFATSNPSGGFAKDALGEVLAQAQWADAVLLPGDVGHNSETTVLIEQLLAKYSGQVTLCGDTLDLVLATPDVVCRRENTLLVVPMAQLQKLATAARFDLAFKLGMDLLQLVEALHVFTNRFPVTIIVKHHEQIVVAVNGQVSSTKREGDWPMWRVKTAAKASVWWLQNPQKTFEALSTSVIDT